MCYRTCTMVSEMSDAWDELWTTDRIESEMFRDVGGYRKMLSYSIRHALDKINSDMVGYPGVRADTYRMFQTYPRYRWRWPSVDSIRHVKILLDKFGHVQIHCHCRHYRTLSDI
jgi:hypothetical protein